MLIIRILIISLIIYFSLIGIDSTDSDIYIVIKLDSRRLNLYQKGELVRSYPVGVGRRQFPTPTGNFKIISKVMYPAWQNPYKAYTGYTVKYGAKNPLGTRWMGFKRYKSGEYGMHGTNQPSSVGKYSSHGCVRMYIKDSEDLFKRVDIGTPVKIVH